MDTNTPCSNLIPTRATATIPFIIIRNTGTKRWPKDLLPPSKFKGYIPVAISGNYFILTQLYHETCVKPPLKRPLPVSPGGSRWLALSPVIRQAPGGGGRPPSSPLAPSALRHLLAAGIQALVAAALPPRGGGHGSRPKRMLPPRAAGGGGAVRAAAAAFPRSLETEGTVASQPHGARGGRQPIVLQPRPSPTF